MIRSFIGSLLLLLLFTSCTVINYDATSLNNIVAMSPPASDMKVVGKFSWSTKGIFLIELLTLKNPDLEKALLSQIGKYRGNGVVNLRIVEVNDVIDYLITWAQFFFIGIAPISTRTVTLEGDIVMIEGQRGINYDELERQLANAVARFNKR